MIFSIYDVIFKAVDQVYNQNNFYGFFKSTFDRKLQRIREQVPPDNKSISLFLKFFETLQYKKNINRYYLQLTTLRVRTHMVK